MADSNTDRLGLLQMAESTHLNEWGDLLNLNIGRVDAAARGFKEIVITGNETLDANDITTTSSTAEEESFFNWIEFTGTAGAVVVTVQAEEMVWNVYNNTNGIITFTPSGGTGTALTVGQAYILAYVANDTAFTDMSVVLRGVTDTTTTRVTTTYTILVADQIVFANTDGGAYTATLPAGTEGSSFRVINAGSSDNDLTLAPNGSEHLIGVNTNFILRDGESIDITYNTTDGWY